MIQECLPVVSSNAKKSMKRQLQTMPTRRMREKACEEKQSRCTHKHILSIFQFFSHTTVPRNLLLRKRDRLNKLDNMKGFLQLIWPILLNSEEKFVKHTCEPSVMSRQALQSPMQMKNPMHIKSPMEEMVAKTDIQRSSILQWNEVPAVLINLPRKRFSEGTTKSTSQTDFCFIHAQGLNRFCRFCRGIFREIACYCLGISKLLKENRLENDCMSKF